VPAGRSQGRPGDEADPIGDDVVVAPLAAVVQALAAE
jgi:hypothetical protein